MATKLGRKPAKNPMGKGLRFRMTLKDENRVRGLAKLYASGDLSKWLRHAALNAPRRFLK